ncbi:MAG: histidine phosphatase family protein [Rhizobiaceae bacterium]
MTSRTLLLMRHAKAERGTAGQRDFDRSLAERGRADAPRMGREIARRGWLPDLALVSPARRTTETWDLASAAFGAPVGMEFAEAIYDAPVAALVKLARAAPPDVGTLMIVGHNPGMEVLAERLAGPGSADMPLAALEEKFPTGALARLTFDGEWTDVSDGAARLADFIRPADLS